MHRPDGVYHACCSTMLSNPLSNRLFKVPLRNQNCPPLHSCTQTHPCHSPQPSLTPISPHSPPTLAPQQPQVCLRQYVGSQFHVVVSPSPVVLVPFLLVNFVLWLVPGNTQNKYIPHILLKHITAINRACLLVPTAGSIILVPYELNRSVQLIWRQSTYRWNPWVPTLQMSCTDLT